jgi:hypothetical protein
MFMVKSVIAVISLVLLLSALPVRAQSCSLSNGGLALTCAELNGNVSTLMNFLKDLDERYLSEIQSV